jgi:hypothetical protein
MFGKALEKVDRTLETNSPRASIAYYVVIYEAAGVIMAVIWETFDVVNCHNMPNDVRRRCTNDVVEQREEARLNTHGVRFPGIE